ncbi:MAG: AbrB/MazE/SpoVT family DNA-binding domain-containing protein [Solirubrobacterales bacterium]
MTKSELHKLIDELPDAAVDGAGVLLRGIIHGPIDPGQAWFWTPEWQQGEREAEAQLAAGESTVYESTDDFISHLESTPPADSA